MAERHLDILGQTIQEGNYVAVSHKNLLQVCKVIRLNPKMMRVKPIKKDYYYRGDGHLVYSNQTILLSGEEATAYILKYAGSND